MIVLKDTPLESGACPIPIHGPQPHSRILAPAWTMSANAPFCESIARIELDPGAITKETWLATLRPFKILAAFIISANDELVQLPITTWFTFIPSSSFTGTTASGLWGLAVIGTSSLKSTSSSWSYAASSSAFISI